MFGFWSLLLRWCFTLPTNQSEPVTQPTDRPQQPPTNHTPHDPQSFTAMGRPLSPPDKTDRPPYEPHPTNPNHPQQWAVDLFGGVRTTGQPSHFTYPVEAWDASRCVFWRLSCLSVCQSVRRRIPSWLVARPCLLTLNPILHHATHTHTQIQTHLHSSRNPHPHIPNTASRRTSRWCPSASSAGCRSPGPCPTPGRSSTPRAPPSPAATSRTSWATRAPDPSTRTSTARVGEWVRACAAAVAGCVSVGPGGCVRCCGMKCLCVGGAGCVRCCVCVFVCVVGAAIGTLT